MGLVVEEDDEYVLKILSIALPKGQMSLVFWVAVIEDSLNGNLVEKVPIFEWALY